ncbi:MAG TPA: hypothetical protein PLV45_15285, partial [bacterium]|nr:hypothetical protein [bacterium]
RFQTAPSREVDDLRPVPICGLRTQRHTPPGPSEGTVADAPVPAGPFSRMLKRLGGDCLHRCSGSLAVDISAGASMSWCVRNCLDTGGGFKPLRPEKSMT